MNPDDTESQYSAALAHASLGKLPPELRIATGHEDEVMLFLIRVGDECETTRTLMDVITLAESESILKKLSATHGLIQKRFPIDVANRLKELKLTQMLVAEKTGLTQQAISRYIRDKSKPSYEAIVMLSEVLAASG